MPQLITITMVFLCSSSDYRSNIAPSDSDRDCSSGRRDSDTMSNRPHGSGTYAPLHSTPRLGVTPPGGDSESGDGSPSPSPRSSRRRTKVRNHSLTTLCLLSHHPFLSTFRECLFVLKKLIDACNEAASPKSVGASRQSPRYVCVPLKLTQLHINDWIEFGYLWAKCNWFK